MKMRRKKLIASSQVETVWNAQGVSSGPSYEAFTIPTPRGLSTIGTPVDTSLTGHKRPASDAEQSHDSASSFGTLLQHVDIKDGASHYLVGSARPSQQGVKQVVLRLSGLRQSPATSGEPSSVKYGEPVLNMGTQAESTMWSNATECIESRQNYHIMNSTCPELQSSSQGATVRALQMQEIKENIKLGSACCGDNSGDCIGNLDKSCCVLDSSNRSGFGQDSFPHPTNPSWILNADVCRSSCCIPPSLNNQTVKTCNACAATRFTTFQPGVSRAVHYISGEDVMMCPAPWVHEGRDESYHMPDPVYPPVGHCNDDLDMETQRHLEEQIAQEILLLSQKLANLQARYGARRPVHNNTKTAVLSCPLTPLLLDITRKSNPRAPSAPRISQRQQPESRCQLEERKLGAGRTIYMKAASSTTAQSSNKGSDSGVQTNVNKNHKALPGSGLGNSTGSRGNGCQPNELTQGCENLRSEAGKPSKTFSSPHRKRRDRETEHVDECCYSDDMKNFLKEEQNVQGFDHKRFDWVKTLRIAGVRENHQGCSDFAQVNLPRQECEEPKCLSKSVQTGGALAVDCCLERTPQILEERLKNSSSTTKLNRPGKNYSNKIIEEMGGLDSKINSHLLKAGLRRAPGSLWKTGGPVKNALKVKKKTFGSKSSRKDGGKHLCSQTQMLLDLNFKAYSAKDEKLGQLKERQSEEVADCEAEYETFMESTDVGDRGCEEEESQPEVKAKLSEAPVLSLMKTPRAPKKTFIRCIDLVVASTNNKKKSNELSEASDSYHRVDGYGLENACQLQPQINEGIVCQNIEGALEQCLDSKEPNLSSTMNTQDSLLQSNIALEGDLELDAVSNFASMLSRVIPKQMESMDAAQLRARWEELIDALEKERLGLPKVKINSCKMGTNSPRDSSGVKRVAEHMKIFRAPVQDQAPKEKLDMEDVSMTRGRLLWSKVEQKQEVVF